MLYYTIITCCHTYLQLHQGDNSLLLFLLNSLMSCCFGLSVWHAIKAASYCYTPHGLVKILAR